MRAFDISGVGIALVLVPFYAWLLGRFVGRRDWRIGGVLVAGIVLVALVQIAILAGQCLIEGQTSAVGSSFSYLFWRRAYEVALSPEFSVFLVVFGTFVTMLGWSATPVKSEHPKVVA